jgi:hypothetical protein
VQLFNLELRQLITSGVTARSLCGNVQQSRNQAYIGDFNWRGRSDPKAEKSSRIFEQSLLNK